MWRPLIRALYYATLFEVEKWSQMATRLAPAPVFIKDPSKYKVQHSDWI